MDVSTCNLPISSKVFYVKILNNNEMVRWQKNNSFANFGCSVGLQRFANVLFCGLGFFVFVRGEKKQNRFPRTAPTYLRSTKPINPFFVINSILFYCVNVSSWWFCTLAYNGLQYGVGGVFETRLYPP